jgi:hypothetical protein
MRIHVFIIAMIIGLSCVDTQAQDETALLTLESDPPGAYFQFGNLDSVLQARADTTLSAGEYRIESSLVGHQPLIHQITLSPGDTLTLRFVLLAAEPVRPVPEDLGLSYEIVMPLIMEEQSDAVRSRYNTMAEVFAIVPLLQGVMAAVALGGGHDYFSAELMVAGVCLSGGSYLLGRYMGKRKLAGVRRENETLTALNQTANQHNKEVDLQIRSVHSEAMREWRSEASWRGAVETVD